MAVNDHPRQGFKVEFAGVDYTTKNYDLGFVRIQEEAVGTGLVGDRLGVHTLWESDFRGHWRVDFWYLKIKPSAQISIQWALFLEIWAISSQISSILSKNDVSSIVYHIASM